MELPPVIAPQDQTRAKTNRRGLAAIYSTGFLTAVPVVFYGAAIIATGDLGGPLNFILIPMLSIIFGFAVSFAAFFPLSLLAVRFGLRRWQQVTGILSGLSLVAVIAMWVHFGIVKPERDRVVWLFVGSHLCFYFVGGFLVYLCLLRPLGDSDHDPAG